jgi:hypothetical protein
MTTGSSGHSAGSGHATMVDFTVFIAIASATAGLILSSANRCSAQHLDAFQACARMSRAIHHQIGAEAATMRARRRRLRPLTLWCFDQIPAAAT